MAGLVFALKGFAAGFWLLLRPLYAACHGRGRYAEAEVGAVGALAGWHDWLGIFIITAILGGAAAIALAALRKRLGKTFWNMGFILSELKSGRPNVLGNEELDLRSKKGLGLPH